MTKERMEELLRNLITHAVFDNYRTDVAQELRDYADFTDEELAYFGFSKEEIEGYDEDFEEE